MVSPQICSSKRESLGEKIKKSAEEAERSRIKEQRLTRLVYPSLSIYETSILTAGWIFIIGYSWYLVFLASRQYYLTFLNQGYLEEGFLSKFTQYPADTTDHEWFVFSQNMVYTIPWTVFHFFGSQLLRKCNKDIVPTFNVLLSLIYMVRVLGFMPAVWMCAQPFVMFCVHLIGSSKLVWLLAFAFLFIEKEFTGPLNAANKFFLKDATTTEEYVIYVTWYWVNSRVVSFCLDRIWGEVKPSPKGKIHDLIEMFAYCFYLPINISGPIMVYKDFHDGFNREYQTWSWERAIKFLF